MGYTIEELRERRSVRKYSPREMEADAIEALKKEVETVNPLAEGVRFVLVENEPKVFAESKKTYGWFAGVKNYIIAVFQTSVENAEEKSGYYGEQLVMKATELGLGTCFVGVTFNSDALPVSLSENEKVAFVIPFGYPDDADEKPHPHKEAQEFYDEGFAFFNLSEALGQLPNLMTGLEALACAPSGMNKQLVRVWLGEDTYLHMGLAETSDYTTVDLGIAKFNFQAVVPGKWEWGVDGRFFQA